MSKHTPGPWEVQRDSHLRFYITQPSDTPDRVSGFYAEVRRFTPDIDQVKANAHLIAAAPDLLEALQRARPHIGVGYSGIQRQEILRVVDEAIAKAKRRHQ